MSHSHAFDRACRILRAGHTRHLSQCVQAIEPASILGLKLTRVKFARGKESVSSKSIELIRPFEELTVVVLKCAPRCRTFAA